VNARKAVLPKLWSVLKDGGRGCAAATFHNLLPLLSRLPTEPAGEPHALYQQFLTNVHTGYVGFVLPFTIASGFQGVHLSGKPGNVMNFDNFTVRELTKFRGGISSCHGKLSVLASNSGLNQCLAGFVSLFSRDFSTC